MGRYTCCHPVWISQVDKSGKRSAFRVRCGHCVNCLAKNQQEWVFRMLLESEVSETTYFVTLTYSDEKLPAGKALVKNHPRRFVKSIRQKLNRLSDEFGFDRPDVRYYLCGEYGKKTNRPHYHLMLFGLPLHNLIEVHNFLRELWPYGFIQVALPELKRFHYIAKYITKLDPREHDVPPFQVYEFKARYRPQLLSEATREDRLFTFLETPSYDSEKRQDVHYSEGFEEEIFQCRAIRFIK